MCLEQKQPKSRRTVLIPDDLVEFMGYVHAMILSEDDTATIESDDLLQCETAYAGLFEQGGDRFGFTYFPEKGTGHMWEFELNAAKIADIAEGLETELVLWSCQNTDCHSMFSDAEATCFRCDDVEVDQSPSGAVE